MNKEWKCFPGSNCPKCGSDPEVFTRSKKDNYVYDEEDVRCIECGHTGMISVEDSECADVVWDDLKESSNECKRKHQKCILTDCNCQPKDINVPQSESNKHVPDTNVGDINTNPHAAYINGDLNPLWFDWENRKDGLKSTDNVPQVKRVDPLHTKVKGYLLGLKHGEEQANKRILKLKAERDKYREALEFLKQNINSIWLMLSAHPDNEPDSEFEDRISDLEEMNKAIEQVLNSK